MMMSAFEINDKAPVCIKLYNSIVTAVFPNGLSNLRTLGTQGLSNFRTVIYMQRGGILWINWQF